MSEPHVLPVKSYLGVFGSLLALTALTTWIAYQDLGFLNTAVAITIAVVKMVLVVLYFMHLRYSSRLVVMVASAGIFWLLILFALAMSDYETRHQIQGWLG